MKRFDNLVESRELKSDLTEIQSGLISLQELSTIRINRWHQNLKWGFVFALVFVSVLFLAASLLSFELVRGLLDKISGDGSADPYTNLLHTKATKVFRILGASILLLGVMTALIPLNRWRQLFEQLSLKQRSLNTLFWWRALFHKQLRWVIGFFLFAVLLRTPYLNDPIRYDEAHTYLAYAKMPSVVIVSLYNDPNNHVLHSLFVHLATLLFGNAEWVIRLPAFLAGCLLVPFTFLAGRALSGRAAGIAAGSIVAASSALIEYSTLGRGYSMICCLSMLNLITGLRIIRGQKGLEWCILAVLSALGLWTVPVMVYSNIILWGWILLSQLLSRRGSRSGIYIFAIWLFWVGVTCLLTLVLYSPIIITSGIKSLLATGFVKQLSITEYLKSVLTALISEPSLLLRDWSWITLVVMMTCILTGLYQGFKNSPLRCTAALLAMLSCILFVIWQRVIPFARVWLFTIPFVSILVGYGFAQHLEGFSIRTKRIHWGIWIGLMIGQPVILQHLNHSIINSRETGICPEAEDLVKLFNSQKWFTANPATLIITASPSSAPIVYYANRAKFLPEHFGIPEEEKIENAVVVVSHLNNQTVSDIFEQLHLSDNHLAKNFYRWEKMQTVTIYRYGNSNLNE